MSGRTTLVPQETMQTPVRMDGADQLDDFGRPRGTVGSRSIRSVATDFSTPRAQVPGPRSASALSMRYNTGKRPGTAAHDYLMRTEALPPSQGRAGHMNADLTESEYEHVHAEAPDDSGEEWEGHENVRGECSLADSLLNS